MDYNSNREKLPMPEYGRNIQSMVNHILTIEDRKERTRAAYAIVDIMGNMYPYLRDVPDFKHKLWDHLAIMSDFNLDIDYPYNPPQPEVFKDPPAKIPYSSSRIRYRHYGKTLEMMIEEAKAYEPKEEKEVLIKLIANQMKKSYLIWNKDAVEDEKILLDLNELSRGAINLSSSNYHLADIKIEAPKRNNNNNKKKKRK